MRKRIVLGIVLTLSLAPLAAQAQRRSPLADAPAIRKRLELRTGRLEVGGGLMTTLNQTFYHSLMANVKLGFHFTDWISLSVFGDFTVTDLDTGFRTRVVDSLKSNPEMVARQPMPDEAAATMIKLKQVLGAQVEWTPFTGKYSLFGKLFAHYDFYLFGGGGVMNIAPTTPGARACSTATNPADPARRSCADSGYKPGVNAGVGFHTFFGQFVALDVQIRDFITRLNPAGRDVNGDGLANNDDLEWSQTVMVGASLVLYLPPTADISP